MANQLKARCILCHGGLEPDNSPLAQCEGRTTAGTMALFLLFLGGAVCSVLGGSLANRYDRVHVSRWSYLLSVAAVTGGIYAPGPAMFPFVALTSVGLHVPFAPSRSLWARIACPLVSVLPAVSPSAASSAPCWETWPTPPP